MKYLKYASVLLILVLAVVGCKHSPNLVADPSNSNPNDTTTTNPVDTGICFERDILPIFISNCAKAGCHDAASHEDGYTLTDYTKIRAKGIVPGNAGASEIYESITEDKIDKRMPQAPNPPLTNEQIALLARWINEGAKNGTGCATSPCDDNIFTYSGAIVPTINTYCKGCHNSSSSSGGINLDNYNDVKTVALNGKLAGTTKHLAGFSAMPQGGSKLSTCQLSQIEKWIAAGAQNN